MALDKLVDSTQLDSDLTSVANAIRAKSGGSSQLAFPAGFVSEIQAIPSGGGYTNDDFGDPANPVGAVTISATSDAGLRYILYGKTGVTEVSCPNIIGFTDWMFMYCSLKSFSAPKAAYCGASTFANASNLEYAVFPSGKYFYSYVFQNCTSLLAADFGGTPTSAQGLFRAQIFAGDTKFGALVLRADTVWPLANINVFQNTKFASGKAGGILYVPASQIANYQAATNWSTILGYTNNQIKSIESTATDPDAPIDLTTHYIDGTPIPTT